MTSAQAVPPSAPAQPSASAQLAAFEAIELRSAAAADRVVSQAEAAGDGERHSSAAQRHYGGSTGRAGNGDGVECDEVQGWLR
jgi:hypothetical protein